MNLNTQFESKQDVFSNPLEYVKSKYENFESSVEFIAEANFLNEKIVFSDQNNIKDLQFWAMCLILLNWYYLDNLWAEKISDSQVYWQSFDSALENLLNSKVERFMFIPLIKEQIINEKIFLAKKFDFEDEILILLLEQDGDLAEQILQKRKDFSIQVLSSILEFYELYPKKIDQKIINAFYKQKNIDQDIRDRIGNISIATRN